MNTSTTEESLFSEAEDTADNNGESRQGPPPEQEEAHKNTEVDTDDKQGSTQEVGTDTVSVGYGENNRIFTKEAAEKARRVLLDKLKN